MDKNVSIVRVDSRHYRTIARHNWGLTREQMRGKHVHHRVKRSEGGTNDPSNLYVCSEWFHDNVWHANDKGFAGCAIEGGRKGGLKGGPKGGKRCVEERRGIFSEKFIRKGKLGGHYGKGSKKPGSGPKSHPIEIICPDSNKRIFKNRQEVCDFYSISLPTLAYYLRQSSVLTKGKFKGYTFRFENGWKRFE